MAINFRRLVVSGAIILALFASTGASAGEAAGSADLLADASRSLSRIEKGAASGWQEALVFKAAGAYPVVFRAIFQVDNSAPFISLRLQKPLRLQQLTLNGKAIPLPLPGMLYTTVPGIPATLLQPGSNELRATWTQTVKAYTDKKTGKVTLLPGRIDAADFAFSLFGQTPPDLAFQTGPILGYAGQNFFTVTCRVNLPAEVTLEVNHRQYVSKPALLHTFKATDLAAGTEYRYSLTARLAPGGKALASIGPYPVRTLPAGGQFTFAVLGDSRSYPREWAKVAAAVVKAKPAFTVFVGDMVPNGRIDSQWDEEYFGPAREFFATIPNYAVIGNHERNCPLFTKIFQTPGGKNWRQEFGPVLIIGIDEDMYWARVSALVERLERVLSASDARFIFLASHYPAWTSGNHGRLDKYGQPSEAMRIRQEVLMPLLKKYKVTAMLTGHDHFYERSEPENGVTMIITGGAGAPLHNKVDNPGKQNPYSKVFAKKYNYCLFTVNPETCTMRAFTPAGELLDTRTWKARPGK